MKKNSCILIVLFILAIVTQSCKKNSTIYTASDTIHAAIKVNQSYQYDLGGFGIEEGAQISKQATYFLISTIGRSTNTPNIIYRYVPAINFVGTDEVELQSSKGSNGSGANNKVAYTTIKFTITN